MAKSRKEMKKMGKNSTKFLFTALLSVFLITLCSCAGGKSISKQTQTLEVGATNTIENIADFTLVKIVSGDKVEATMPDGIYYTNNNSEEQFIDVVLDYTNKTPESIVSNNVAIITAKSSKGTTYQSALYAVETNGNKYVSKYESIAPLATVRLHCAVSVPKTETEFMVYLNFGSDIYSYDYNINSNVSNAVSLLRGGIIDVPDYGRAVFKGTKYTDDLLPANTSSSYNHYQVDNSSNTYLVAEFEVTNLLSSAKKIEEMISAKAIYSGKYTYSGFVVMLSNDARGFDSGFYNIEPLSKRQVYVLIEVPKTVSNTDFQLEVIFNNQEYIYAK